MREAIKIALMALFFLLLVGVFLMPSAWRAQPAGTESFRAIGEALFGPYLLAFEILSILLLAALIGAIWMARRESL